MTIKVGSRKSRLALWQAERIADLLAAAHDDVDIDIVTMDTLGDRIQDRSIPEIGGKGLFTAELERALTAGAIDLAVHSLKDLPTELPDGLVYAGSPERGTPTDSLVSRRYEAIDQLPADAIIATGSIRRRAQLRTQHPGVEFRDLRGNIGTRLEKLDKHGFDGIIMATVALERLQIDGATACQLPVHKYVPAVGQGALGIEIRRDRDDVAERLAPILDADTVQAVRAERVIMARLEGGCSVPLGAYCAPAGPADESRGWRLLAWAGSPDGRTIISRQSHGDDPGELAEDMADELVAAGARDVLAVE